MPDRYKAANELIDMIRHQGVPPGRASIGYAAGCLELYVWDDVEIDVPATCHGYPVLVHRISLATYELEAFMVATRRGRAASRAHRAETAGQPRR